LYFTGWETVGKHACDIGRGYIIKQFGRTLQIMTVVHSKKYKPVKMFPILPAFTLILEVGSLSFYMAKL